MAEKKIRYDRNGFRIYDSPNYSNSLRNRQRCLPDSHDWVAQGPPEITTDRGDGMHPAIIEKTTRYCCEFCGDTMTETRRSNGITTSTD